MRHLTGRTKYFTNMIYTDALRRRIGQLISNAARAGGWESNDVFYCPNEVILNGLNKIVATERELKS